MAARYSYHCHIVNIIIIITYIVKRECSSKFEERFRALMKQVRSTQVVIDEGIIIIIIVIIIGYYYYYYYYQLHSKQKLKVQNLVLGEVDHRVDQVLVKDVQHHIFLLQVSSLPLLLPLSLPL